jgi:hypothetical protein
MAKGKAAAPKKSASGKEPKAKKASKPARRKGFPMFKMMFLAAVIGLGYAAFTVHYKGRTAVDRAVYYVTHDTDVHFGTPDLKPAAKKGHDAVADRRHPAEHYTQADKDALNHLIP